MSHAEVKTLAQGLEGTAMQGRAALFETSAKAFLAHHALQDEVFGAAAEAGVGDAQDLVRLRR